MSVILDFRPAQVDGGFISANIYYSSTFLHMSVSGDSNLNFHNDCGFHASHREKEVRRQIETSSMVLQQKICFYRKPRLEIGHK